MRAENSECSEHSGWLAVARSEGGDDDKRRGITALTGGGGSCLLLMARVVWVM
ncbi:MAG: hypothetical protein SPE65_04585 [Muribaculaceae bacterium]|nr:hypothetical protein [Muribaculaceae bacterium]MDY5119237.1 hypothetical protein [Muribaculaceae bacterium]